MKRKISSNKHSNELGILFGSKSEDNGVEESSTGKQEKAPEEKESANNTNGWRATDKAERQEFFLPVSGFVWFFPEEVKIIDHPTFQRLSRIYQTGQTNVSYRGATHKRIEHALGTVQVVQRIIDAVSHNSRKANLRGKQLGQPLSVKEERFVRLGALLHDIGHIPLGHTIEDELCLTKRHDSDERLQNIFENRDLVDRNNLTLAELIDKEYSSYVPTDIDILPSKIIRIIIRKQPESDQDPLKNESESLKKKGSIRINVCRDMIGNTICADLLDYIHRDWYHIGKPRPDDDRILQYMEIRSTSLPEISSCNDCFVISLGKRPKIRTDAISAILELLEWRYQLAESVLFHRTKATAAAMLDRALYELWGDSQFDDSFLLSLSDEELLSEAIRIAAQRKDGKAEIAKKLLTSLKKRELFVSLLTRFYDDLPADVRAIIQRTYGKSTSFPNTAPKNRWHVINLLEEDFNIPHGSLAMYCPTAGMNVKIAEVKIAVGDEIREFCQYEVAHNNQLAGGHLDAQIQRFSRLWRVHFVIDEKVMQEHTAIINPLRTTIEKLVLGYLTDDETYFGIARDVARILTNIENSLWCKKPICEEIDLAAFSDEKGVAKEYRPGVPCISAFIGK